MGKPGGSLVIEQRAATASDASIAVWDRENWVASLGNRPGYDRPGNVISGTLLGYEPEVPKPAAAAAPKGKFRNNSNHVPPYFAACVGGECQGGGTIRSERSLTHTVRSPFFTGPLRSPLRIQNTFANECFMDELATQAKADPVAFRLKHLRDPRLIAVVEAAANAARWEPRPATRSFARTGRLRGRGIACVNYEGDNGYSALIAVLKSSRRRASFAPRVLSWRWIADRFQILMACVIRRKAEFCKG